MSFALRDKIAKARERGQKALVIELDELQELLDDRDELWEQVQSWQREASEPGYIRPEHDPNDRFARGLPEPP